MWPKGLSVLKEEQFPSLVVSFCPYLGVFKVVMVADSVCQKDLCTRLQFIGQGTDKWIPLPPLQMSAIARKLEGHRLDLGIFSWEQ